VKPVDLKSLVAYPETAILTAAQLCAALQISRRTLDRYDFPCFYVGRRLRFRYGKVLKVLENQTP